MILFIDCEWADVLASELVSLALVSDCGRFEFYAERDPLPATPTDFVRSAVYPRLERVHHACSDAEFTRRLHAFFASVAGVARHGHVTVAYDHQNDLDLLNYALDGFEEPGTPERPALRAYNLGWMGDRYLQVVEECFATDPELRRRRHHALIDARANRDAFLRMRSRGQARQVTLATLGELRQKDPELATFMVETLGDEAKAAAGGHSRPSRSGERARIRSTPRAEGRKCSTGFMRSGTDFHPEALRMGRPTLQGTQAKYIRDPNATGCP